MGGFKVKNYIKIYIHNLKVFVGRDGIPVRRPDSQSREPGFKSHCGRFEPLASLITPRCHSSLSCINEYLAIQTVVDMWTNSLRAAIAAWLNTSQRSWDGLGMNRSASGWSVKRFEQSYGPDTALYKNIPLPLPFYGVMRTGCSLWRLRPSRLWKDSSERAEEIDVSFSCLSQLCHYNTCYFGMCLFRMCYFGSCLLSLCLYTAN